jgi:hypothetical protein
MLRPLKNLRAEVKAASVLRLAKSSDQALCNYSTATKRASFLATFTLKAHKAPTPKVVQDKRLLVIIILKA